jgi:cardiolipin synthase A/B
MIPLPIPRPFNRLSKELAMDAAKLQDVADRIAMEEPQAVVGKFDPDRWPALTFETFDVTDVRCAVSPDCSYRLVRDAFESATATIDFYIYNVSAEHLLQLIRDAKGRGVAIRIMYDVMDTNGGERAKINALGVETKEAPSSGRRKVFTVCHQKFAVIDGKTLVIESANWASTSIPLAKIPGQFKKGNREWLIRVDHAKTAEWFADLFQKDWDIEELDAPQGLGEVLVPPQLPDEVPLALVTPPPEIFDIESPTLTTPAALTPITSPDNYLKLVKGLIRGATTSIMVEQQSIKVGGPKTKEILEELGLRKGDVEIRIIVSPKYSWEDTVASLEAAGLDDCLRAMNLDSFTHLHNKGMIFDRETVVVTSTNWTENSVARAREGGVAIKSTKVAEYYARVFDIDWGMALDPADVPAHLAVIEAATNAAPPDARAQIHPADLRVDLAGEDVGV